MDWELIPNEGIPALKLGDDKAMVRARFGEPRIFRRTQDSPEADQFTGSGMLVTYGLDEKVVFIELTHPSNPIIRGSVLLGQRLSQVLDSLVRDGISAVTDNEGASIVGWRVGLYAPSGTIEGVSVGE